MKDKEYNVPEDITEMTIEETLYECGRMRFPIDRIIALLRPKLSTEEKNQLIIDLRTPGSDAYNTYESGKAKGEYEIFSALKKKADGGDAEAAKFLSELWRENALVNAIHDKF